MRRFTLLRRLLAAADVPVWRRISGIDGKVRVRLVRDLAYRVLPRGPEVEITSLFETVVELFALRAFWDVGAYFGYYGFLVGTLASETEVVFCEADPLNADLIRATIARNPGRAMTLREVAVSDAERLAVFFADRVSGATGSLIAGESAAYRNWGQVQPIDVETAAIDGALGPDGLVDLIKIDVEGHEEAVIRGAAKTLERCRPFVVFECFHGGGEISEHLERLGYEMFDAERLAPLSADTTNFFALPPQHREQREELLRRWRDRIAGGT